MIINKILYDRIVKKKKELDSLRPIPKSALEALRKQFLIELTFNSNAIEGNTLTLNETKMVLEEGITIRGKSLGEHLEAINHLEAFEFMESLINRQTISEEDIRKIHKIILEKIDDESAGSYRRINVRVLGALKSPPRFEKIPQLMRDFVNYINKNPDKLNLMELAAKLHHRFVEMHPFADGNGRTSRLLMNLFLIRNGYPITSILKVDRKKYYDCLKKADQSDIKPFIDFIGRNVERSLDLYLDALKPGEDFVTLREASKDTKYSQEYLSLLARKGRIEAVKLGRNWHIKKSTLEKYSLEKANE